MQIPWYVPSKKWIINEMQSQIKILNLHVNGVETGGSVFLQAISPIIRMNSEVMKWATEDPELFSIQFEPIPVIGFQSGLDSVVTLKVFIQSRQRLSIQFLKIQKFNELYFWHFWLYFTWALKAVAKAKTRKIKSRCSIFFELWLHKDFKSVASLSCKSEIRLQIYTIWHLKSRK